MTKTVRIEQVKNSIQAVIDMTSDGDEIVLEKNGQPLVKVIPFPKSDGNTRTPGLGKGYFMSDDFNDELPDEFWGFDKEL